MVSTSTLTEYRAMSVKLLKKLNFLGLIGKCKHKGGIVAAPDAINSHVETLLDRKAFGELDVLPALFDLIGPGSKSCIVRASATEHSQQLDSSHDPKLLPGVFGYLR